ncbi:MAG: hypothetical protein MUF00_05350 [Gemmatimonadaceae bacterium]|jgi:photosystem II stability/assembly factor-like uncharacterized protein|nr:hypothetical protein [Gemmatimonadaceae bacterium]
MRSPLRSTTLSALQGALLVSLAPVARAQQPLLTPQPSGVTTVLQAVSVVSADTVWVSGHRNTLLVTHDGGRQWRRVPVPGDSTRQWRDLHAFSGRSVVLMSAGTGAASTIVRTDDGGATWRTQFVNADATGFYDCLAFFSPTEGFAFSDAVDGRNPVALTRDGEHWSVARELLPPSAGSEGAFAASGLCAITRGARHGWIVTGAGRVPRVHRTTTAGRLWETVELPLVQGDGAGATAIAMRDTLVGIAVGGAIGGTATGPRVALTRDGGRSWRLGGEPTVAGAVYGVTYVPSAPSVAVAVGPGGAMWSADDGVRWQSLDAPAYWSVGCANTICWLAGRDGRITRVEWR